MPVITHVSVHGDSFLTTLCQGCGRSYEEAKVVLVRSKLEGHEVRKWICRCQATNPMVYHPDDCPCTIGGLCEQEYAFEDKE